MLKFVSSALLATMLVAGCGGAPGTEAPAGTADPAASTKPASDQPATAPVLSKAVVVVEGMS